MDKQKIKYDQPAADFRVVNHGTIFVFYALTESAREHAEEAFADAMTWGRDGYVVEHRYAQECMYRLASEGFAL